MKTLIFDIDGTLTNLWPLEKTVLLFLLSKQFEKRIEEIKFTGLFDNYKIYRSISKKKLTKHQYFILYNRVVNTLAKKDLLPQPKKYPLVSWIISNKNNYTFIYATGGQRTEALYVLAQLNLSSYFDLQNSIDKTSCRFSKTTGIPLKRIKAKFEDCLLVTDTVSDCEGAVKAKIPYQLIKSNSFVPFLPNFV